MKTVFLFGSLSARSIAFARWRIALVKSLIVSVLLAGWVGLAAAAESWRSALYPEDWTPPEDVAGLNFTDDRMVQDFSFAGYHRGEVPLPTPVGPVIDVVVDFGADATGRRDATAAIQAAIDKAATLGGGVVFLPEGTYRVSRPEGSVACLTVAASNIVLRGAGVDRTFLFNTSTAMRGGRVVLIREPDGGSWQTEASARVKLTRDELGPTVVLSVASVADYAVGDWIVVHNPATPAFVEDLNMGPGTDAVNWQDTLREVRGLRYLRRIVGIDAKLDTLTIDIPTRWSLKTRDGACVYRATPLLSEVGLEHFSIGNRSHPGTGWEEEDYHDPANASYDTHDAFLVEVFGVVDSWIYDVRSYNPGNDDGVHFLANGVLLSYARNMTLRKVEMQRAQFGGGGGNGYGIRLNSSSDNLVEQCETCLLYTSPSPRDRG